jgi:cold shock CspA family protein/ribosome-associated translation inhibitor RaiA
MQLPLQITFRDIQPSAAVTEHVRRRAEKLDTLYERITSCRVAIETPNRHVYTGKHYTARIDITVPGAELVAARHPLPDGGDHDVHVAIDRGFDEAERLVLDHAQRIRGDVKRHDGTPHGRICKLFRDRGYGFIEVPEAGSDVFREIYFHKNSVLQDRFDQLELGMEVRFAEEEGDKGPQASTVEITGRHRRRSTMPSEEQQRPSVEGISVSR